MGLPEQRCGRRPLSMKKEMRCTSPLATIIRIRPRIPATRFWLSTKTGKLLWSQQATPGDVFNNACSIPGSANCPPRAGHDFDFGQPPILVPLPDGHRELVLAQKSGVATRSIPTRMAWCCGTHASGQAGPREGRCGDRQAIAGTCTLRSPI